MSRRTGMWITMLCILAAGIGITKINSDFVSANTAEIAAAGEDNSLSGGRSMAKSVSGTAVAEQFSYDGGNAAKETETETKNYEEGMEAAAAEAEMDMAAAEVRGDMVIAESVLEEAPETVKSPLDPEVREEKYAEDTEISIAYTSADISERLAQAESQASRCRESAVESNLASAYASAKQEYALWDRERNLIYNAIVSRMSQKEADTLKLSELEWMKERDMAADKTIRSAANQNQNPDYVKVMARYTRERCYALYEDYSDILDREPEP
ncbi:lysozyme inhibitor LprI family protein [Lachnospiraceae bacterium 45-P1]